MEKSNAWELILSQVPEVSASGRNAQVTVIGFIGLHTSTADHDIASDGSALA